MKKPSKISAGLALAFATVLLAGCGGGSDDDVGPTPAPAPAPSPSPAPVAASDPTVALVTQIVGQGGNETAEPLVLSDVAFPTNDTTEPDAV